MTTLRIALPPPVSLTCQPCDNPPARDATGGGAERGLMSRSLHLPTRLRDTHAQLDRLALVKPADAAEPCRRLM